MKLILRSICDAGIIALIILGPLIVALALAWSIEAGTSPTVALMAIALFIMLWADERFLLWENANMLVDRLFAMSTRRNQRSDYWR